MVQITNFKHVYFDTVQHLTLHEIMLILWIRNNDQNKKHHQFSILNDMTASTQTTFWMQQIDEWQTSDLKSVIKFNQGVKCNIYVLYFMQVWDERFILCADVRWGTRFVFYFLKFNVWNFVAWFTQMKLVIVNVTLNT